MKADKINLNAAVKSILLKEWDPIGVGSLPEAQDEYDLYVPQICLIISQEGDASQLLIFLRNIEENRMELPFDEHKARQVADSLLQLKKTISGAGGKINGENC